MKRNLLAWLLIILPLIINGKSLEKSSCKVLYPLENFYSSDSREHSLHRIDCCLRKKQKLFYANTSFLSINLTGKTENPFISEKDTIQNGKGISNENSKISLQPGQRRIYSMDEFIGTNAFIDVPQDKMKVAGFIREYHPWGFTEVEDDKFEYNRWNGFWDFDTYYKTLKESGIDVCPAIWGSPSWLKPNELNKPVVGDESPLLPNSYREMAEMMFQFSARYGYTNIHDSLLLVADGQVKKSGLGYIRYYEDWNEQDSWWVSADRRFTPHEYAAMVSANVDGHGGEMGLNFGLKQADPSAKFVMGGLAVLGTDYISQMFEWFKQNRIDHSWPIDVINMHVYCENNGLVGNSPEDFQLKQKVTEVVRWRDEFAPDNEFWITEFGYDMNNTSVNRVPIFAGFTQEQVQAQWLLRTFLILSSTGVDRASQFMLRDQEPENFEPRFRDCGLTSSHHTGYIPKLSWYSVNTMKDVLKDFYFDQVIIENSNVWAYRYSNTENDRYVVAVWCPTSSGKMYNYSIAVPEGCNQAELVIPDKSIEGIRQKLVITSGEVMVIASEMAAFIEFTYSPQVGVNDIKSGNMLFSNPVNDFSIICWPFDFSLNHQITVKVFDMSGRVCYQSDVEPGNLESYFNFGFLKPGTYLLAAIQRDKNYIQKLIKTD